MGLKGANAMKRFIILSIVLLVAALMLTACTGKKAPEQETLTAEEILQLPKSHIEGDWFYWPKSFAEAWARSLDSKAAVVKGKATSVKYYYGFESKYNCTLIEFQIDEVIDEYNTASLKPGDVITIASRNYIGFESGEEVSSEGFYDYFSEKTGLDIHDLESYKTARKAYSAKDAASQKFELIPKKGVEYYHSLFTEFAYPLQNGESYTMLVTLENPKYGFGKECYGEWFVFPLNEELSYKKMNEKYGFRIEPFGSINEEIAEMFK